MELEDFPTDRLVQHYKSRKFSLHANSHYRTINDSYTELRKRYTDDAIRNEMMSELQVEVYELLKAHDKELSEFRVSTSADGPMKPVLHKCGKGACITVLTSVREKRKRDDEYSDE